MARAPLVVKREVDQATSDWAQHHAKRLIDTKAKGLRGSIPPNFPYFYVQFGYSAGFVHVIDDEAKFSPSFGRQVGGWVAGRAGCGGGHGAWHVAVLCCACRCSMTTCCTACNREHALRNQAELA
jgi:hypothetical protein